MSSVWQKDLLEYIPGRGGRPLSLKDTSVICRKLSFMLDAGISIKASMEMLSRQSSGRVRTAVSAVLESVSKGDSLSSSLASASVFPKLLCGLTAMGESAGCLPEVMAQAADYYERRAETENELAGAMTYPALVSVLMLAVIVMAVTFVLPSYARVFDASEAELPAITKALLGASGFLTSYGYVLFLILAAAVFILRLYFKNRGRVTAHAFLLRLPLYRKFINAQFAQVLSLTLTAGQNLTDSLPICAEVFQNAAVKRSLAQVLTKVSSGEPLHEALAVMAYMDTMLIDMVRVGEETGMLRRTMLKCRAYFEQAYTQGVKRLNKLAEPVLTILLGAVLGALMLAVILPTFRLADLGW